MKIYYHPASTTSRPLMLFAAESGLKIDFQVVDLMKGEHHAEWYATINPSKMVPALEDGDFRMTESSAILKYLCNKFDLPEYPTDLKKRGRVDEVMDWFNTQFYRDFAYGMAYPQVFPHHKRPTDEHQKGTLDWAKERAAGWLSVLDKHIIGKSDYLCGDKITIADYYGASFVHTAAIVGSELSGYPNVKRWLGSMKKLKSWPKTFEVVEGFAASLKGPFEKV